MAWWLITEHMARKPQAPLQGSTQRSFWHAKYLEQSISVVHSGRQFGARPMKLGRQEQAACDPTSLH